MIRQQEKIYNLKILLNFIFRTHVQHKQREQIQTHILWDILGFPKSSKTQTKPLNLYDLLEPIKNPIKYNFFQIYHRNSSHSFILVMITQCIEKTTNNFNKN